MARHLVHIERISHVMLIGLNRPAKKNCVNLAMAAELFSAFKKFERDPESRIAILHGLGGNFCTGFDLGEIANASEKQLKEFTKNATLVGRGPMGPSRMFLHKPTIAAISGYAVAGGLELALMCDFRVVEQSTILGVFCRRVGVPLIDGGTIRLPRIVGLGRALELILTGREIGAKEAMQIGLANRVSQNGSAVGDAVRMAIYISRHPQECMLADRRSVYHSVYEASSMEEALKFEAENGTPVITTEALAGALEFMDRKRKKKLANINNTSNNEEKSPQSKL